MEMIFILYITPVIVGILTGILSGFGIGGGTILILYLTIILNIPQQIASGTNLLYFIVCAPAALISHIKNKLVDKKAFILCTISGVPICILASFIADKIPIDILKRIFGVFLLYVGFKELLQK